MPPPEIRSARDIANKDIGYSSPPGAKKCPQCGPAIATAIVQASRNAPTLVRNPSSTSAPPINSDKAAAPIHNHPGRMKGNGGEKLVNFAIPGPSQLPSTFPAPCAIKTAASASRSGTGVQDEDVEIILLNIGNPFHGRGIWKSGE